MPTDLRIRPYNLADLPSVLAVQQKCPHAAQWLEVDYTRLAGAPGGVILVAEIQALSTAAVVGFVACRSAFDEAELMNLAVDPALQRRGFGRALVREACGCLAHSGIKNLFLEARSSNEPALALYQALGFTFYGHRKDYYQDPQEDAQVLRLELQPGIIGRPTVNDKKS